MYADQSTKCHKSLNQSGIQISLKIHFDNSFTETTLRKWEKKLEANMRGRWKVVTLEMAININGHRGYPRKCPAAQQNIQEHIRSCVWIEFENIKTRSHKWLYVVKMSITQLYWYCTNLLIFLLYGLILTWWNVDQIITFAVYINAKSTLESND